MGGKSSPPPAPDYTGAARQTAEASNEQLSRQTRINRPTMNTPWGTSAWADDGSDNWTNNVTLSPEQQQALNSQMRIGSARSGLAEGMLGRVGAATAAEPDWGALPSAFSFDNSQVNANFGGDAGYDANFGGDAGYGTNFGGNAGYDEFRSTPGSRNQQNVTGAGEGIQRGVAATNTASRAGEVQRGVAGPGAYSEAATAAIRGRQAKQLENQRAQTATQLTQQGVVPGSEAWKNAMDDVNRQQNDADMAAITAGLNQGNIEFGQGLQQGQFANDATGRAFSMDMSANSQNFGQQLQANEFGNRAQAQDFDQRSGQTRTNNDTRMRDADFVMRQGAANNEVRARRMADANAALNANNEVRSRQLADANAARNASNEVRSRQLADANTARNASNEVRGRRLADANAALNANNAATSENARLNTNFANTRQAQRQAALQEMLTRRQLPLNEMNAFLTGQQVTAPNFSGAPNTTAGRGTGADYTGAVNSQYGAAMNNFGINQAQQNSMWGGLGNIASMFSFSDVELKEDIEQVGSLPDGTGLFNWNWKDGSGSDTGVLAQEVEMRDPSAVRLHPSGFKQVDYAKVLKNQLFSFGG